MKSMVNLHNSCNEGVDASDEPPPLHRLWLQAHDFYETTVEPYVQLLDSPRSSPTKLTQHSKTYSLREDLLVSLSSSSMSERTGELLDLDRGDPVNHRLGLYSLKKKSSECQARISQHEFQAARATVGFS